MRASACHPFLRHVNGTEWAKCIAGDGALCEISGFDVDVDVGEEKRRRAWA